MAVGSVGAANTQLAKVLQERLEQNRDNSEVNRDLRANLDSRSVLGQREAQRDLLQTRENSVRQVERTERGQESRLERRTSDVGLLASKGGRGREGRESEQISKGNADDRTVLDQQRQRVTTSGITAEGRVESGLNRRRLEAQRELQSEVRTEVSPEEQNQQVQLERRAVQQAQDERTLQTRRVAAAEQAERVQANRQAAEVQNQAAAESRSRDNALLENIRAQRQATTQLQAPNLDQRRIANEQQAVRAERQAVARAEAGTQQVERREATVREANAETEIRNQRSRAETVQQTQQASEQQRQSIESSSEALRESAAERNQKASPVSSGRAQDNEQLASFVQNSR